MPILPWRDVRYAGLDLAEYVGLGAGLSERSKRG
jgi:hypothetical protein